MKQKAILFSPGYFKVQEQPSFLGEGGAVGSKVIEFMALGLSFGF